MTSCEHSSKASEARLPCIKALGLGRLYSYINVANTRSQAVAKRLGAVSDGTRAPHEPEAEVWVHPLNSD
jgi:RimJ/RimL family protein N-acetyltransferase